MFCTELLVFVDRLFDADSEAFCLVCLEFVFRYVVCHDSNYMGFVVSCMYSSSGESTWYLELLLR
jgi:hypothetical protein